MKCDLGQNFTCTTTLHEVCKRLPTVSLDYWNLTKTDLPSKEFYNLYEQDLENI
jgi:hypothetical protein